MAGITDLRKSAEAIRRKGRHGDDILVHMSNAELQGLGALMPMKYTINPQTGLPELFSLKSLLPIIGAVAGTFIGGPAGGAVGGALGGAIAGGTDGGGGKGALTGAILGGAGGYFGGGALQGAFPSTFAGGLLTGGGSALTGAAGAGLTGTGLSSIPGALSYGGGGLEALSGAEAAGLAGGTGAAGSTLTGVGLESIPSAAAPVIGTTGGGLGSLLKNPTGAMIGLTALGAASGAGGGGGKPPEFDQHLATVPEEAPNRPRRDLPVNYSPGFDPEERFFDGQQYAEGGIVDIPRSNATPQLDFSQMSGAIDPSAYGPLANVPQAVVSGPINAPVYQGQPASQQNGNAWPFISRPVEPVPGTPPTPDEPAPPPASFLPPPPPPIYSPPHFEPVGADGGIVGPHNIGGSVNYGGGGQVLDTLTSPFRVDRLFSTDSVGMFGLPAFLDPAAATGDPGSRLLGYGPDVREKNARQEEENKAALAKFNEFRYADGGQVVDPQALQAPQAPQSPPGNQDAMALREETKRAILGMVPNPQHIISLFVETFGQEAFDALQQEVMAEQEGQQGAPQGSPDLGPQGIMSQLTSGAGGGLSDSIPASIEGGQPARLSDGEYVVPADVVSGIGDGSTAEGERKLSDMVSGIRQHRTGTSAQPSKINPDIIPQ